MNRKSLVFLTVLMAGTAAPSFAGDDRVVGAVIGGVAGGAIGHEVGGRDGAALGVVLGAVLGASIADGHDHHRGYRQSSYYDNSYYNDSYYNDYYYAPPPRVVHRYRYDRPRGAQHHYREPVRHVYHGHGGYRDHRNHDWRNDHRRGDRDGRNDHRRGDRDGHRGGDRRGHRD